MKSNLQFKSVQVFIVGLLLCLVQVSRLSAQLVPSEWRSAASGTFANAGGTVWEKLVTGTWTLQAAAAKPSGSSNVTIRTGHTVTLDASPTTISILNLTIESGATLNSALTAPGGIGLRLGVSSSGDVTAGYTNNVVTLTNNGTFGSTTGTGDGINLEVGVNCASLTVTGTGTTRINRFRPLQANPNNPLTITFDQNVDLMINNNYALTATQNSATNSATENVIVNINAGKTVKIVNTGGFFHGSVSSSAPQSNASGTYTYNISGILDLSVVASGGLQTSTAGTPSLNLNIKNGGVMKLGTSFAAYKGGNNGSINMTIENGGMVDGTLLTAGITNNSSTLGTGYSWFVTQGTGVLKLPVSSTSQTFPIGPDATHYNPVTMNNGGGTVYSARVATGNAPSGLPNVTKALNRTWTVSPASTADLNFGFNTGDGNASCVLTDPMGLYNSSGGAWTSLGTATPSVPSSNATNYQVGYTGVTFAGTIFNLSNLASIPVELMSFKANAKGTANLLDWTTASERNNREFAIERSTNGLDFQNIGSVKGNGNSATARDYNFMDNAAPLTIAYYRLRQIDFDGKEVVSKAVTVARNNNGKVQFKLYPSVTNANLSIETDVVGDYQVINRFGQVVLTGKVKNTIDVSKLSNGQYILKVGSEQEKFVKF